MGKNQLHIHRVAVSFAGEKLLSDDLEKGNNFRRECERVEHFYYEHGDKIRKWLKGRSLLTLARLTVSKPDIEYDGFSPIEEVDGHKVMIEVACRHLAAQLVVVAEQRADR